MLWDTAFTLSKTLKTAILPIPILFSFSYLSITFINIIFLSWRREKSYFAQLCLFIRGVYFTNYIIVILFFATLVEEYLKKNNHELSRAKDHNVLTKFCSDRTVLTKFTAVLNDSLVFYYSFALAIGLFVFMIGFTISLKPLINVTTVGWSHMYSLATWAFNFSALVMLCAKNRQLQCEVSKQVTNVFRASIDLEKFVNRVEGLRN